MNPVEEPPPSRDGPSSSGATFRNLLEQVKADDPTAWERLVGLYGPLVYRWCRRWDLPDQETADIFQNVFQALAQHIAGFRKEKEGDTFRGWLRTITDNKVRDYFRERGREPGGEGGTEAQMRFSSLPADGIGSSGSDHDLGSLLKGSVDVIRGEFEWRTWQAFWLTAVEGRLPRDVALELGISPGAVRVAKSRVLKRLRDELGGL
jgi:RNA polymerase sigma-70 factor (ECF subfamily)